MNSISTKNLNRRLGVGFFGLGSLIAVFLLLIRAPLWWYYLAPLALVPFLILVLRSYPRA